jgi:murein DD-endopeptidase MepM/ murein hydrolase activator NlpD
MTFHIARLAEFLQRPTPRDPETCLGNAAHYGVQWEQANAAPGTLCWRVIGVHHLTPDENRGNHVVYVDVVDEAGHPLRSADLQVKWGWAGQRPDEPAPPKPLDKPSSEPATNVEMYSGQQLWIELTGEGLPSDTVRNLHTKHADEPGPNGETWNSIGHHSFYVLFQRVRHDAAAVHPDDPVHKIGDGAPLEDVLVVAPFRFEAWPTEQRLVTQPFGVNPERYQEYGLAGHEGVDIAAATGSAIFAVAPGAVKMVQPVESGHPYGIHVRITHRDGYETTYAHLQSVAVAPGQPVAAGQLLGLADSTGNARGEHLHLTLKRDSAVTPGYPDRIIDPMPFLQPLLATGQDDARYVRDLVADGTPVKPSAQVDQRWTVRNTGSTSWGAGYVLAFESGVLLGEADILPVPPTAPGAEVDLPLTFAAPPTPGSYRSYWRLRNGAGQPFGERLWVDIAVQAAAQPLTVVRGNKLGFYLHLSTDQFGMWNAIQRVQPPVILVHADSANDMLLNEIRAFRAPDALVIGRWYITNDEQRALLESADPAAAGRAFAERIVTYDFGKFTRRGANGRLLIDAWMSLNECLPGPASDSYREDPARYHRLYAAYDQFQVAFHRRMAEAGLGAVAFNFAAGNFTEAAHYLDFFPQTLATYTYLGFHEYGWPSLIPGPGVATGAGIYRRVLEAIRAGGNHNHRVVMTEAGLTRAYGHPFPDEGWLNAAQPLAETQYWGALAWYNHHMAQDDYVIGACLYEVGHDGNWASFRHLGHDNGGQAIHLVDRLVALREAAVAPRGYATAGATATHSLIGHVRLQEAGVAAAIVSVASDLATLGAVRGVVIDAPGAVSWSRSVDGFAGTLRNAWDRFVAGEVAGITWDEFKRDVRRVNPTLAAHDDHFVAGERYLLPEPSTVTPAFLWDRPLTGYRGTIYQAWLDLVQGKVLGLDYAAFRTQLVAYNPSLADRKALAAAEQYLLPRTVGVDRYRLTATTSRSGRFRLTDLPAGVYTVAVDAPEMAPFRANLTLDADLDVEIDLLPLVDLAAAAQPRGTGDGAMMGVIGREFVVNRRAFRFIGVNLRGLVYYGSGLTPMLKYTTKAHREESVAQAQAMGAKVVRVFLPCVHANADQTIALLHEALEVVGRHGMYLLPAFVDFYKSTDFRIPGDEHFYERLDPNFHHELLNGNFYRGGYRQRYLPFVQSVVEAFRNDARIFAWEVGNELKYEPAHADPGRAAFLDFMLTTAYAIKQIDPNHLVTTGMISTSHASLDTDELWRKLYENPAFDFLTVHCYNREYQGKQDDAYARTLNKPFIVEEAGFGKGCPGDRVALTRQDMDRWFGLGASGYMQWGFMPVPGDIGDGDDDAGMDRKWHGHDFDGLFALYQERAATLHAQAEQLQLAPPPAPQRPDLAAGETVYAQTWVNVRTSPGHLNKAGDDVVGLLGPGAMIKLTGESVRQDGLWWWPVEGTKSDGDTAVGWVAEATAEAVLLKEMAPPLPRTASYNVIFGIRTDYAQSFLNLRQSPGYVGKAADDVVGQIPLGAPVTVLAGPEAADELQWWQVRAPLLDDKVGTGWVADHAPNGFVTLAETPPPAEEEPVVEVTTPVVKEMTVVAVAANLRAAAGYRDQLAAPIVAEVVAGTRFTVVGGPVTVDDLEWLQVATLPGSTPALRGWLAVADPNGVRILAPTGAQALQLAAPFAGSWPLTQGWGSWPEFYAQFIYDGVPLKGHNGLDFGTPPDTPLLACDAGAVLRVDFEAGGFGNFVLLRHRWGESLYAHLNRIDVAVGSAVTRGQTIGLSGATGAGTGAHLHFGIRLNPYRRTDGWGGFCDPSPYLDPTVLGRSRSMQLPTPMAPELPGRRRP